MSSQLSIEKCGEGHESRKNMSVTMVRELRVGRIKPWCQRARSNARQNEKTWSSYSETSASITVGSYVPLKLTVIRLCLRFPLERWDLAQAFVADEEFRQSASRNGDTKGGKWYMAATGPHGFKQPPLPRTVNSKGNPLHKHGVWLSG